jgi:hypothetical protein
MAVDRPPARLAVILARDRPVAAVFRRGPTRWTRVITWRTDSDEIEPGDWFRGRLYDRRCDLSPDGSHLVYFAAAFGVGVPGLNLGYAWSAVSRLPSLEPIVAWEKDHCWYGGGLFEDDYRLWVNEPPPEQAKARSRMFALTFNDHPRGEDEPVFAQRLTRDGWALVQEGDIHFDGRRFVTDVPELRRKAGGHGEHLEMARSVEGFSRIDRFALTTRGEIRFDLPVASADFDQTGRLVAARDGLLLHLKPGRKTLSEHVIADLNDMEPDTAGRPHLR